jgi:hypothetical protein
VDCGLGFDCPDGFSFSRLVLKEALSSPMNHQVSSKRKGKWDYLLGADRFLCFVDPGMVSIFNPYFNAAWSKEAICILQLHISPRVAHRTIVSIK